jgi:hypothetical protein
VLHCLGIVAKGEGGVALRLQEERRRQGEAGLV